METTPPPIQAPTAKEKKYDRQLRLWAASGQRALEEAHILLIIGGDPTNPQSGSNSSVTGIETLKNLVLPGIGNFSIADCATVTEADLGVNFFLEAESLGKSRAQETVKLLQELNPDVSGRAVFHEDLERVFSDSSSTLTPYSLIIICAPLPSKFRECVCRHAKSHNVPLMYVHCAGFYSYFSIGLPSAFPLVDTHPDADSIQDLRILAPWAELSAEALKLGQIQNMDDHDHGHIPYILLLLYYLEQWNTTHSGLPSTYKEKSEFRDLVRSGQRTSKAEGPEENFDEACAAVIKTLNPPNVGSGCKDMFEMSACTNLNEHSANFWIIANAIRTFYKKHSLLPLPGSLPDMKARSADYISLQNIYKSKARADVAEVLHTVRSLEKSLNRQSTHGETVPIPEAEVEQFCKNAAHVKVLTGSSLIHTRLDQPEVLDALERSLNDPNALAPHLTPIFLSLLQTDDLDIETRAALRKISHGDELEEVQRAAHGELHNIASLTGGQVAQEAIKLITRQYVPVDNLCVFDGIASRSEVLNF